MPAKTSSKLLDVVEKNRAVTVNAAISTAKTITWVQIVAFFGLLAVLYQFQITQNTCFQPGTTDCVCSTDVRFQRWFFLALAVLTLIDLRFSVSIGEKFWGGFPIVTNVVVSATYALGLLLLYVIYGANANVTGYIVNNIATNPASCGDPLIYADVANLCEAINPTSSPLDPPYVAIAGVGGWSSEFWALFGFMLAYLLLTQLPKTICTFIIPESYSLFREVKTAVDKLDNVIKTKNLPPAESGVRTGYEKSNFYTIYDPWHINYHMKVAILDLLVAGVFTCIWFGWFQQEARSYAYKYTYGAAPSPHTVLSGGITNMGNFLFYFFLSFNLMPVILNGHFMNFRYNYISFLASASSVFVNLILGIFWLVYWANKNRDGQGTNIANDMKFCKAYIATPYFQFYTNPANMCPNTYTCADQVEASTLGASGSFTALGYYLLAMLFTQSIVAVFAGISQARIRSRSYDQEELREKEEEIIDNDIDAINGTQYDDRDYPLESPTSGEGGKFKSMDIVSYN